MKKAFGLVLIFFLLLAIGVQAQDQALAPPEVLGEVVYIPFPVDITLDGDVVGLGECSARDRGSRDDALGRSAPTTARSALRSPPARIPSTF